MKLSERATVLVALLLLLAGCLVGFASASAVMDDESVVAGGTDGGQSIEVAATGVAEAEPNQVQVHLRVEETAETAARARRQLAENSSRLRDALGSVDVPRENVTTTRYDISYDAEPELGTDGPYRAVHEFVVTTSDSDRAGRVIDAAAIRGDAQIDGVRFGFSRGRYRTLKQQAVQDAMAVARERAATTADTEGLRLTGVHQVQTGEVSAPDTFDGRSFTTAGGGGAPTDLVGGPRTVQVRVVVTYNATG